MTTDGNGAHERAGGNPGVAEVVAFWQRVVDDGLWMAKDPAFDRDFRSRFLDLHMAAAARRCDDWIETPEGALALMVLLDQFPRNAFRGSSHMYATDGLARMFAREAEHRGHMLRVEQGFRVFFVYPFTHSEALADQTLSLALSARLDEGRAQGMRGHHDIIQRFGRFPHRNRLLGRASSAEEEAFLADGGFAG
ncbi:MAG TPA: DUF924 family protein [Luteimonas sp.]|nr:DUF924 family protein [Luteimonas sp.]HRP71828.1 DUF924 family protein [Luteimonas sp.]